MYLPMYPLYLHSYTSIYHYYFIYLSVRAQILTPALVLLHVLLPVPPAAVRRHLALPTIDVDICPLLAARVVADPSQLLAQTLMLDIVPHGVVLATVDRHSARVALLEPFAELQVRGARLARRVVASSSLSLSSLRVFNEVDDNYLEYLVQ